MGRKGIKVLIGSLAAIGIAFALVFAGLSARGFIYPISNQNSSQLLIVGIDSWIGYPNGLPDMLAIMNLETGELETLSRSANLGRADELGLAGFEFPFCKDSCTPQNAYSAGASGDLEHNGISEMGLESLKTAVSSSSNIESLSVLAFDLVFARSFLNRVGDIQLETFPDVWIGPSDQDGIEKPKGYLLESSSVQLKGDDLYWFARSRYLSSESERSIRQKILIEQLQSQKGFFTLANSALFAKGQLISTLSMGELLDLGSLVTSPTR